MMSRHYFDIDVPYHLHSDGIVEAFRDCVAEVGGRSEIVRIGVPMGPETTIGYKVEVELPGLETMKALVDKLSAAANDRRSHLFSMYVDGPSRNRDGYKLWGFKGPGETR